MRMMMKVQMDTEAGSRAIADGSLPHSTSAVCGHLSADSGMSLALESQVGCS